MQLKSIADIEAVLREALRSARNQVPKDKGNLRYNSIKLRRIGDLEWEVYIDQSVALYAQFVNENIPSHHTPKQFANEKFWDRFCKVFMRELQNKLGGKLDRQIVKKQDKENK